MKKIISWALVLSGMFMTSLSSAHNIGYMIMQGNTPLLEHVLDSDNVNKAVDGMTPLNFAIALNKPVIVRLLLAKQADINLANPNDGIYPLERAILMSGPEVQGDLLNGGANVNQRSKNGYYYLQLAIGMGNTDLAKILLDKGAEVNSVGNDNTTPIILAASRNNLTVVRWLVSKGAPVNGEDSLGNSPLSSAASDNVELIKFLIEKGADPAYRNSAGRGIDEQRAFLAEVIKRATPAQK